MALPDRKQIHVRIGACVAPSVASYEDGSPRSTRQEFVAYLAGDRESIAGRGLHGGSPALLAVQDALYLFAVAVEGVEDA
ncbi:MAG: hypothetical protein ACRDTR_09855, partial [Rubrobacter sp.]